MSWCRSISVALLFVLCACGFTPMHGQSTKAQYADIDIANIPDRDGQYLRNFLIDRLYTAGRPGEAPLLLQVTPLKKNVINMGLRKDATSTRGEMEVDAHVTLIEKSTHKVLLERDVRAVGGFNQLDNQFATLQSENSLTDHVLEEIGGNIIRELDLYFSRTPS